MPIAAIKPENELERLITLQCYNVLDTDEEATFDRITDMVADLLGAPIVLVSLVDEERQWFKSHYGLPVRETHRDIAFCAHAILSEEVFYIPDATKDERFQDSPLVLGGPNIRTYAGAPLIAPNGHKLGTICTIYDKVTVLDNAQLALLEKFAAIVVDELELRFSIEQLTEANIKVIEANEAKSRFLAIMSHEIRTPMSGILGSLELASKSNNIEDIKTKIQMSYGATRGLLSIVDDILDFTKLESGKISIERINFLPSDAIAPVFDVLQTLADKNGIQLTENLSPDLVKISGDPTRLRQVLFNLIGNSIKFTKKGSVDVNVEPFKRQTDDFLRFTVTDTGIGMSEDVQKNIFKDFSQGDSTTTRKFGGTGLGLYICTKLVELMGGTIGCSSKVNKGSQFWIEIPAHKVIDEPQKTEISTPHLSELPSGLNVLLVEDDELIQMVLEEILNGLSCNVTVANNGIEGLALAKKYKYDAIFMDGEMPLMGGIEATGLIRNTNGLSQNSYIIALTANALSGDRNRYLEAGMNEYLPKPVDTAGIKSALLQSIRR